MREQKTEAVISRKRDNINRAAGGPSSLEEPIDEGGSVGVSPSLDEIENPETAEDESITEAKYDDGWGGHKLQIMIDGLL